MQNAGAAWLMTSLAPEPFVVALVQVASNLPFFLLAIPAGALADVLDRRRLLTFTIGLGSALLSMLNAAAQISIASGVRARALAIYMLVLFGGLALGRRGCRSPNI